MLEKVTFNKKPMKKAVYKEQWDELLAKLVVLQQQAHNEGVGLVVLFEGWNGAGKGSRISDLMYQLDARATTVFVPSESDMGEPSGFVGRANGVTGYFPFMEPFWRALGERGAITFFDRGWYTTSAQRLMYALPPKDASDKKRRKIEKKLGVQAESFLNSIEDFESQLVDDGYVVVKFFLHIREKTQRKRLTGLAEDPSTAWRVSKHELEALDDYERTYRIYDRFLHATNYSFAPWVILNGEDKRRANLTVARTLVEKLDAALHREEDPAAKAAAIEPASWPA